MKKGVHPESKPICFIDVSNNKKFFSVSTAKCRETREIDGVTYGVVLCDITSDSHPAYTGVKRFVDSAGQIDKFKKRFSRQRPSGK